MTTNTANGYYSTAENTAGRSVTVATGTANGHYNTATANPYGWEPILETIPYTAGARTISTIDGRIYTVDVQDDNFGYTWATDRYRAFFTGNGAASRSAERDEEEDIEVDSSAFDEFMGFDE